MFKMHFSLKCEDAQEQSNLITTSPSSQSVLRHLLPISNRGVNHSRTFYPERKHNNSSFTDYNTLFPL